MFEDFERQSKEELQHLADRLRKETGAIDSFRELRDRTIWIAACRAMGVSDEIRIWRAYRDFSQAIKETGGTE